MKPRLCKFCNRPLDPGMSQCRVCKAYTIEGQVRTSNTSASSFDDGTVPLSEVVAVDVHRTSTGPWDPIFGTSTDDDGNPISSGITDGTTALLGGEPGAGKSTLALQMASSTVKQLAEVEKTLHATVNQPGYVLYLAGEEAAPQIRGRANRLKLPGLDRIRVASLMSGEKTIEEILQGLKYPPVGIILDSTDGQGDVADLAKMFKAYCTQDGRRTWAVLIHHVNKQFEFTGEMDIQHATDATIAFMTSSSSDKSKRSMVTVKNRNGKAGEKVDFTMTERGLVVVDEDEEDEEEFVEIPYGTIPTRNEFLDVCPNKVEIDNDHSVSAEKVYEGLKEAYADYQRDQKNGEYIQQLVGILEACGFCWEEKQ